LKFYECISAWISGKRFSISGKDRSPMIWRFSIQTRHFQFLKPESLALKLKHQNPNLLIIDVREAHMFEKQHIRSAVNIDSKRLLDMTNFDTKQYSTIVVHCQLSLIRGPSCALHIEKLVRNEDTKVVLLDGGFKSWSNLYGNDQDLTETSRSYSKDYL
jgi:rhodanese-related sulfurtransferase